MRHLQIQLAAQQVTDKVWWRASSGRAKGDLAPVGPRPDDKVGEGLDLSGRRRLDRKAEFDQGDRADRGKVLEPRNRS